MLFLCCQRYGLWDHEGPINEDSPSEHCDDEIRTREEEDVSKAKTREEKDTQEKTVSGSSTSQLEKLEKAQQVSAD